MNKTIVKLVTIFWCLTISFVYYFYTPNEVAYQRFSARFTAAVEMFYNGYVSRDALVHLPFFSDGYTRTTVEVADTAHYAAGAVSNFPNLTTMYLIIMEVTNISQAVLITSPLAPFIFPIAIIAVLRIDKNMISADRIYNAIIFLLFTYLVLHHLGAKLYAENYVSAFSTYLLLIAFFVLYNILDGSDIRRYSIILLLVVFSLMSWWHTVAIMTVFLILAVTTSKIFTNIILTQQIIGLKTRCLVFISIISILIFVSFNRILDDPYIVGLVRQYPWEIMIDAFVNVLSGSPSHPVPNEYNYRSMVEGEMYFQANLVIHAVAAFSMVSSFIYSTYTIALNQKLQNSTYVWLILVFSLGISQSMFTFFYSSSGLGLRYVPVFFIVASFFLMLSTQKRAIQYIVLFLAIVLVLSSLIMLGTSTATDQLGETPESTSTDIQPNFEWLYHNAVDRGIYTDFSIYGKYVMYEAERSKPTTEFMRLRSSNYQYITGQNEIDSAVSGRYSVVDKRTMAAGKPVHSYDGRAQLEGRINLIESNKNLNKIYSEKSLNTYQFK